MSCCPDESSADDPYAKVKPEPVEEVCCGCTDIAEPDTGFDDQGDDPDDVEESEALEQACCGCTTAPGAEAVSVYGVEADAGSGVDPKGTIRSRLRIQQMDCPTEEKLIRDRLASVPGVQSLEFNLMQRVLTVSHHPGVLEEIKEAIHGLGFSPEADADAPLASEERKSSWVPLALAGLAALGAEVVEFTGWGHSGLAAALALVAIAISGLGVYRKGWVALRNRNLNINALMSIAVTGAMLIGQWPEAAMVMVLFALAELIEGKSIDRARRAIRGLLDLTPATATVQQEDGSWQERAVKDVSLNAVVRVRPGERIGLDGEVLGGQSTVNQAPITGESLPVEKAAGDKVFAGTINQSGSFHFRVTAGADDTTLARIIHAVEEAQGARAPTQRFVDQFARIYTPVVFVLAVLVAVVPPLLLGGVWLDWIYRALVLLVVACPCALVISTPVTIVSGLAAAARQGILVKGGAYLEQGRRLTILALDKTGTLTHGQPRQMDQQILVPQQDDSIRRLTASLARRSDHPVSQALAHAYQGPTEDVEDFAAIPGRGIRGRIDGQRYHLGNHRLLEELGLCSAPLEERLGQFERQGKTVVALANDRQVLALFAVADTVRQSSREAVAQLHGLGIRTLMLTGDNQYTADAIGRSVDIDETRGNLLPQDKLSVIERLAGQGAAVGMVGDGINDAPALARADIGFAMGAAGSDIAIETADVALMDDDLRKIPAFVRLSRRTARVLAQNIALAVGIKAVFLVLTLTGAATMWMAVFADMGASLLVVGNGLRMLRQDQPRMKRFSRSSNTTGSLSTRDSTA